MAAESRQLDSLKEAMRASLAWGEIVREKKRLDLKESESALAEAKLADAKETVKTRLKECWCYLICPHQESAQSDIGWTASKVPAQDGLLSRASKKLMSDEGLLPDWDRRGSTGISRNTSGMTGCTFRSKTCPNI
jgi:uncharacterized protein